MRRQHVAAGIAAMSVIIIATGMHYIRGSSTPVDVSDAVERFRAATLSAASPTPSHVTPKLVPAKRVPASPGVSTSNVSIAPQNASERRPLPKEGVYVYATKGGDEVNVLGGSRHTYPSETTVTIRHAGCGLIERWDALDERWDERETCRVAKGDALRRFTSFHEFFRHADKRTYTCDFLAYPVGARPGDTWTGSCVSGKSTVHQTGRALGFETISVGAVRIRALHVRVDVKLTGEQEGTAVREVWGDRRTGLSVLERASTTSYSVQPVFGRTRYHEAVEIRLRSLQPRA